uniref:T-box transcription factor Tbx6b n=1 Tax=Phallusia mammillata TaxID=59560 RepID=A0A6F9DV24_9ASCI|nr:T-box transcription factor Tbx6b [Phallusia mammillata]
MESLLSLHGTATDSIWQPINDISKDTTSKMGLTSLKPGIWQNNAGSANEMGQQYDPSTTTLKSLGNPSQFEPSSADPHLNVELHDFELWSSFSAAQTEMIVTKTGRRMFPGYRIKLSGLDPNEKYCLLMDIVNVDQHRYKFQNGEWRVAGRGEPPIPQRFYLHPHSPATGKQWMKDIVSFHKVKLTNSCGNSSNGKFLIHSMHRYQPRIHVVRASDVSNIHYDVMSTFAFPQTVFITVTAYQNHEVTKLKIENNPFARGFRNEGGKTKNAQLVQTYRPFTFASKRMMGHHTMAPAFTKRYKEESHEANWTNFPQPVTYVTNSMTSHANDVSSMPLAEINNYRPAAVQFSSHLGLTNLQDTHQQAEFTSAVFPNNFSNNEHHQVLPESVFTPPSSDFQPGYPAAPISIGSSATTCIDSAPSFFSPATTSQNCAESYATTFASTSLFGMPESSPAQLTQSSAHEITESYEPQVTTTLSQVFAESYSPQSTQSYQTHPSQNSPPDYAEIPVPVSDSALQTFSSSSSQQDTGLISPTYQQHNYADTHLNVDEPFSDNAESRSSYTSPHGHDEQCSPVMTSTYQDINPSQTFVDSYGTAYRQATTNAFSSNPPQHYFHQAEILAPTFVGEQPYLRHLADNGSPPSDEGYISTAVSNPDDESAFVPETTFSHHDNAINLLLPASP